jgi:ParB-like chromosome segregation protein Spo0J
MTKDSKMNREFSTKDYSKFKRTRGNRPIDPVHVERIKKSIAARDLKLPIYVTKDMEIREGHHTFAARRELGLEI